MEVLTDSDSPVLISNAEVMTLLEKKLKERKKEMAKLNDKKRKQRESKARHSDWIEEKVYDYLKTCPCVHADVSKLDELHSRLTSSKRQRQSANRTVPAESSSNHATVTSFGLTEAEAIQIANFMPTEPVEIHLMVEELHNRMTEAKQQELLQCIASYRKDTDDK
jgi:DNA-directed RNA polymerase subunit F